MYMCLKFTILGIRKQIWAFHPSKYSHKYLLLVQHATDQIKDLDKLGIFNKAFG
jgi:hypothetical protein